MSEPVANLYLEQEVLSASPAKLRWLLIDKCVKLTQVTAQLWRAGDFALADQWSLRLRDILSELLSGVHGTDALSKQVSDLYVFKIKLLTEAEQARDLAKLSQLQDLLETDAETWLLVQQKLATAQYVPESQPSSAPPPPMGGLWSGSIGNETSLCIDA